MFLFISRYAYFFRTICLFADFLFCVIISRKALILKYKDIVDAPANRNDRSDFSKISCFICFNVIHLKSFSISNSFFDKLLIIIPRFLLCFNLPPSSENHCLKYTSQLLISDPSNNFDTLCPFILIFRKNKCAHIHGRLNPHYPFHSSQA